MQYTNPTIKPSEISLSLIQGNANKSTGACRDSSTGQSSTGAYEVDE